MDLHVRICVRDDIKCIQQFRVSFILNIDCCHCSEKMICCALIYWKSLQSFPDIAIFLLEETVTSSIERLPSQ